VIFLKSTNKEDAMTMQHVVTMMEEAIPLMENPDPAFLSQLEKDLESAINTHGMMVIQSCAKCLCAVVSKVTSNNQLLENILQRFLINLFNAKKQQKANPPTIIRAIFVIGLLCRYHDFGTMETNQSEVIKALTKQVCFLSRTRSNLQLQGDLIENIYNLFEYFARMEDLEIRVRSIQGQGLLFMRRPKLLLKAKDQINKYLHMSSPARIKVI
jgi:hypothetical protein